MIENSQLAAELRSNAGVLERVADRAYSADLERRAADEIERLTACLAEAKRDAELLSRMGLK